MKDVKCKGPTLFFMLVIFVISGVKSVYAVGPSFVKVVSNSLSTGNQGSIMDMTVFNGKLYAGTEQGTATAGCQVICSSNGIDWYQVNITGFGNNNNTIVHSLTVFNNYLYAGVENQVSGSEIWRSSDGTTWQSVSQASNGFGQGAMIDAVFNLYVFNGKLFAGTLVRGGEQGAQLWSSYDGINWSLVSASSNGFGQGTGISSIKAMKEFGGFLYVDAGDWANFGTACALYRSSNGTNFSIVSATSNGFGNSANINVDAMEVYNGWLYASVCDNAASLDIFRSSDGTTWNNVVSDGWGNVNLWYGFNFAIFDNKLYIAISGDGGAGTEGGQVRWTTNGTTWQIISQTSNTFGQGSSGTGAQWTLHGMAVFSNKLYVGTEDFYGAPFGYQIWQGSLPYAGPFYVATNGNDANEGSYVNPFKTIQHAADVMSAGPPQCTAATTYIFPGTYSEQVTLASNKNSGYMVFTALSNNNKPVLTAPMNYAFFITNAHNVRLQNMKIKLYWQYGVYLTGDATNVHIENNIIYSNTSGGIRVVQEANDNNYIVSNIIFGGGQNYGIEITWGDNIYIYGNEIFNNQQYGIYGYWSAANNYVAHNKIYNNSGNGINFSTTGNFFYTNQIYNNSIGIRSVYGDNNIMKSNSIYSNNNRGIEIWQCDNNSIISNQIFGNNQEGIYLEYKGHQVRGNKIYNNKNSGINAHGQTNEIIGNEIYKNEKAIMFSAITNSFVAHNVISSNGTGIGITNGNWNTITSNTFFECTNAVLIKGDSKTNSIYSNSMFNNYDAIKIEQGANNEIILNNIYDNYWDGIYILSSASDTLIDSNIIKNNNYNGIYLADDNSDYCNIVNNTISGPNQNYGIRIFDSDNIVIRSNIIYNHLDDGIYINGTSLDNFISQNNFYSNTHSGLHIEAGVQNNSIATNVIWGLTQAHGIYIDGAGPNTIFSNQIFQNQTNGIYLISFAANNIISNNIIYSNDRTGIQISSDNADNNRIVFNNIYGLNQDYGIWLRDGDNNIVYSNQIHNNQTYGVDVYNTATYNEIKNNSIFSNDNTGVYIYGENCDTNIVQSNRIYGLNQEVGILVSYADDCDITKNLIKDGSTSGVRVLNSATNTRIINNTVAFCGDGVYGANTSSARIHNNIFILNSGYGINNSSFFNYIASYNDFYMNSSGSSNGNVIWGDGNITSDPQINTTSTFEITSSSSPAVDSGTNIPGITDGYQGLAPDMGWKESPFLNYTASADILVVDDDNGVGYELYYTNALHLAGYSNDYWSIQNNGSIPLSVITQYNILVWLTGDDSSSTITSSDTNALNYYLNMGKKLFISGQDIGYDINNNVAPEPTMSWYNQYLKASFLADNANSDMLNGIAGDPTFGSLNFVIAGGDGANNQNYESEITTNQGSKLILQYTNAAIQYGGIKYDGTYRLIYFAFGFEAINNQTDRSNVMRKVINWLYNGDPPPPPIPAQFVDSGQRLDGAPGTTYDIAVGDVDGDGDIDVVYANSAATDSQVFTNDGNGHYGMAQYLDVNPNIETRAIKLFDVDNDGDLDIVQGINDGSQPNIVWINTGNAFPNKFVQGYVFPLAKNTRSLGYGDIDKDGDLDLIEGRGSGNNNSVFTNDGTGVFKLKATFGLTTQVATWMELLDIDNDGDLDLYVGNSGNDLILTNDGNGNFATLKTIPNGKTTEADAADVNGDGYLDLAVSFLDAGTTIVTNDGTGNTGLKQTLKFTNGPARSVKLGDINNDGFIDLIEGNSNGNLVYTNDGKGNFSLVTGTTLGNWDTYRLAFADVDKDNPQNDLDVHIATYSNNLVYTNTETSQNWQPGQPLNLTAITNGNTVSLIWSRPSDDWTPQKSLTYNLYVRDSSGKLWYYAEDITGTKNNQTVRAGYVWTVTNIVLTGLSQENYSWGVQAVDSAYLRSGWVNSNFQIQGGLPQFGGPTAFGTGVQYSSISLGDIDNDGDMDLIVTGLDGGSSAHLDKYVNDGTGNFSVSNFGVGVSVSSIALGDIDGDGDLDLIVTGGNRLDEYINDGTGSFIGPTAFGTGVQYSSISLGDIDNDGDLDLIVTGDAGGTRRLDKYINDGAGNFTGPTVFGTAVSHSSIALVDIDADSDLDLIVTGDAGGTRRLDKYINDGAGNFTGPTVFGTGVYDSSIALGDIDNDGDLDLIVTGIDNGSTKRLDKYINNGIGNFTIYTGWGVTVNSSSIALGDVDNDGDLDLIVTGNDSGGANHLDKYLNDGIGNFTGPTAFGFGVDWSSIALGDIDNEGDMDLIVTGWDGSAPRLDKYINNESTANISPFVPTGMTASEVGGSWRLSWSQSKDDHTSQDVLRYQIAIGTNSGIYDIASTNIDYPRGQANLGKVTIVTGTPYYQTKITNSKTIYWKVCAIDSAFKYSAYCSEQVASPPPPYSGPFYVSTNGNNSNDGSYTNPFRTIQHSADVMSAGPPQCTVATTYIFPGTYSEQIGIYSNKNSEYMVITALSNNNKPVLTAPMNYAFFITNADNIRLQNMEIKMYAQYGIYLTGNATNVHIENNIICSNATGGIRIVQEANDNNHIVSNIIFGGGQNNGIELTWGDNTYIYGNNIFNNQQYGIYGYWSSANNYVSHNNIYNNSGNGINFVTTGNLIYTNQIYNNSIGIRFVYGANNIMKSNSIYSNNNRGIEISQCNNNSIISNQIFGNAQEGIYLEYKGHQIIGNKIFYNKNEGINGNGQTNDIINNEIYKNNRGIILSSATNYFIKDNYIYSNNFENIQINNSRDSIISNNTIFHSSMSNWSAGVWIGGDETKNLYIKNNLIYSNVFQSTNWTLGIFIQGNTATNIVIYSNEFYGVAAGVRNEGADFVQITNNYFHNLQGWNAIEIATNYNGGPEAYANSNTIISNTIYGRGINIEFGKGHSISDNIIRDVNIGMGIRIDSVNNFIIQDNDVRKAEGGIRINSSSGDILYNTIISNGKGIFLEGNSTLNVKFNRLTFNTNEALEISTSSGYPFAEIRKNNFAQNNINFATSTNYDVRTNWWGTSIKGAIKSKFGYYGPPPITINFEPYRLWHIFNLQPGADTDTLPSVTGFTATIVNNTNVNLIWNKISDPDFVYYCIYRSLQSDYGNLEHITNYIIATTTNTNYTDTPGYGVFYYWVTAVDNPTPPPANVLTNESWYSEMQTVTVGTGTNVWNATQDKWYWTIQSAVNEANTGDTIIVYPYGYPDGNSKIYEESIEISTNTTSASNLKIIAYNWTNSGVIDTVIDGTGNGSAIQISDKRRIKLSGFKIKNDTWNGLEIKGESISNIITHNIIYSNNPTWSGSGMPPFGLLIQSPKASDNIVASNEFYNNIVDIGFGGSKNNTIFSNQFYSSLFEGVALFDDSGVSAKYNIIKHNLIYDMPNNGIGLHTMAVSNTIISNEIYSSTNGIYMEGGSAPQGVVGNIIAYNKIYNGGSGFEIDAGVVAQENRFVHNIITNNSYNGFYIASSNFNNNLIASNLINNNNDGIYIEKGYQNTISSNRIINNTDGIYLVSASNTIIEHNVLNKNSIGVKVSSGQGVGVELNTIVSNNIGVWFTNVSSFILVKNNIYSNTWNLEPLNPINPVGTNNWWGTTIWTNIANSILGGAPPSSDLQPWRLFGPFDISYGADTDTPTRVDKITSGIINGTDVVIKWQSTLDNGGSTLARYFIYKWYTNSPDNISRAQVVAEVPPSQTSWTDFGGWTGTKVYYTVTALDDYQNYTNESWYGAATSPATNVWNVTKNAYYSTIKNAIVDADGSGVFNEIRVLIATNYYEKGILLDKDQNIKLVSSEWLNSGSYTDTIIITTNKDALSIFNLKGNSQLDIEGFTINFAGTNEDWGANKVSGAIKYDDSSSGSVKHIYFNGMDNGRIGIFLSGWGGGFVYAVSNRIKGFTKSGAHVNREIKFIANIVTNCSEGVTLDGGSENSLVSNNTFISNNTGIMCWGNDANERIVYNLIVNSLNEGISCGIDTYPYIINNTIAHSIWRGIAVSSNSSPVIKNNIIFSNGNEGIFGEAGASPQSSYNNVYGHIADWSGTAFPGTGDISSYGYGIFLGGFPYNYHLADGSPSIAAGENSVDQGCYPYNALLRMLIGDNTKPTGTFQTSEQDIAMVQIKFITETSKSVILNSITFTNYGFSSLSPPLEISNVMLYADVNNNGLLDGSDSLLKTANFGANIYASFNAINLYIPGNSETNLLIVYNATNAVPMETYWPNIVSSDVGAQTNGVNFTVYGNVTGNTQTVASGLDHFQIQINTTNYAKVWAPVSFTAKDSNDLTISSYNGTISNWMINDINEVIWTNISGNGSFTDGGTGNDWSLYTFDPADNGTVTLYVKYMTNGTLNVECRDTNITSATDDDTEGDMFFTNAPVWNWTKDTYYGTLGEAIADANSTGPNEIRIMYSYNDGDVVIATNTTSATQFYITSQEWVTSGTKNTVLDASGYDKAISVDSSGMISAGFSLRIEGFTIKNAYVNGIELLANTSQCTIANMVMISNGYTASNLPGPGGFGIYISDNQQAATYNNTVYSNEIRYSKWGMVIMDADNNHIYGNILRYNKNSKDANDGGGIAVASLGMDTTNNFIYQNTLISNNVGVYLGYNGDNIKYNSVYSNNSLYNKIGVYLEDVDNNQVYGNYVSHNTNEGISLRGTVQNNQIYDNSVFTNKYLGINLSSTNSQAIANLLYNNDIKGNETGYYIESTVDTRIYNTVSSGFSLQNNTNAIFVLNAHNTIVSNIVAINNINGLYVEDASNTRIQYNRFNNNSSIGIKVSSGQGYRVMLNTIVSNNIGVWLTNVSSFTLVKNNIYTNTTFNLETLNPGNLVVTNNWWGTTVWSNIQKTIEGTPPASYFLPWRLFGPFNITIGADTTTPDRIEGLTAITQGPQIKLTWNKCNSPDFIRYFVYRSTVNDVTNLSPSYIIAILSSTNYTDNLPYSARWYYWVTALDSGGGTIYTNESWYSSVASASNSISGYVHILPPNEKWTNTIQAGVDWATNNNIIEVYSKPGGFNESVNISGYTNLTIRAYDWVNSGDNTTTIIVGSGESRVVSVSNSKKVRIQGFSITGATNGIYIVGTSVSNRIEHNRIEANEYYGIYINSDTADNNYIFSNVIISASDSEAGIYIGNADKCIITNNEVAFGTNGIYLIGSAVSNRIGNNTVYSTWMICIYINGGGVKYNEIRNNEVYGSKLVNGAGINIWWGIHNTVISNTCHNLAYYGFNLGASASSNQILYNECYSNSSWGGFQIGAGGSGYNNLIKGNIFHNEYQGARLNFGNGNGYKNTFLSNTLFNNRIGVNLLGSTNTSGTFYSNNIMFNNIYSNGYGILRFPSGPSMPKTYQYSIIKGNNIYDNTNVGVYLGSELHNNYFISNYIYKNQDGGLFLSEGVYSNTFAYNEIYSNQDYGIRVTDATTVNNLILSNQIYGNQDYGIYIVDNSSNIIKYNTIYSHQHSGIFITNGDYISLTNNKIYNNNFAGIKLSDTFYITLTSNTITHSTNGIRIFGNNKNVTISGGTIASNIQNGIYMYDNAGYASNFTVSGCQIFSNHSLGIDVYNSLSHNWVITNCNIYNNDSYGIRFVANDNNKILKNNIYRNLIGINISPFGANASENNQIKFNNIYSNTSYGVRFVDGTAASYNNIVYSNVIYNNTDGIQIYDVYNSSFEKNEIYNCDNGIYLITSDNNEIVDNIIYNNSIEGINLDRADNNKILQNTIYNNDDGIWMGTSNQSVDNVIIKNIVYKNRAGTYGAGIQVYGTGIKIYNNTVYSNKNGILTSGSISYDLKNNITYENDYGYYMAQGQAPIYSLSKDYAEYNGGGAAFSYGAFINGEGNVTNNPLFVDAEANDFRLNWNSPAQFAAQTNQSQQAAMGALTPCVDVLDTTPNAITTHKIVFITTLSNGSIPQNGYIDITYPAGFNLTGAGLDSSSIVGLTFNSLNGQTLRFKNTGSATTPGLTEYITITNIQNINTEGSNYSIALVTLNSQLSTLNSEDGNMFRIYVIPKTNVHNVTQDKWYNAITNAIAEASNGNLIEVYPGTYNESVNIMGFTNLTIRAWSWTNSQNNTNSIIDATGFNSAFILNTSSLITIQGFSITGATNGVYITGTSVSNYITRNRIYSNETYGIYINSDTADNNYILTNEIYGTSQNSGIFISDADSTTIKSNHIHNNLANGIVFIGSVTATYIVKNEIHSNSTSGIYSSFDTADNNYILTNNIYGANQDYGIYLNNGDNCTIRSNKIHNNQIYGIFLNGSASSNYIIKNTIYSNQQYGISINASTVNNNYILTNNIWGANQDYGVSISGYDNTIQSNQVHNNQLYGMYLDSSASTNYIVKNTIYSNDFSGIYIISDTADNNYILTNEIWGLNQNYGIRIDDGDNTIIRSNQIHNNQTDGIYFFGSAEGNSITKNTIYSNDWAAVYINSDTADNNAILINEIWGLNQDYGVFINSGDNNTIQSNNIHNNQSRGINFGGSATNNYITRNSIYSNDSYGIYISSDTADNNYILTNNIWGANQNYGIYINQGDDNRIYRNLIRDNQNYGIYLDGGATNVRIINNTIFGSGAEDGVYWTNSSTGTMYNNIILSNGDGAGDYGIQNAGTGIVYVAYNDIYGNFAGATNGSLVWGPGNVLTDPMIETVTSFTITTATSPAVDSGTNYWGAGYNGVAWDMGWKESSFTNIPATNVHNVTQDKWYNAITNAIAEANNNNLIEVYPGIYNESVAIANFTNLILRAWAWTNAQDNTNTKIVGSGESRVVSLSNSKKVTILGFSITGATNGVYITDNSVSNYITHNIIYSNETYGVFITNANYSALTNNEITLVSNGILIKDSEFVTVYSNYIHNFEANGIYIVNGNTNKILKNRIQTNSIGGNNGIYVDGIQNNISYNDITGIVAGVNSSGIYVYSDNNSLTNNKIHSLSCRAIEVNGDNCNIVANNVYDYLYRGIAIFGNLNNISFNTVHNYNNTPGIIFWDNTKSGNRIFNNVIYSNEYGILLSYNIRNTLVSNNIIYDNNYGIYDNPAGATIVENQIFNNFISGIHFNDITNVNILYNNIYNNLTNGIYLTNVKSVNIELNTITSNQIGIKLDNDVTNGYITKNNIYTNTTLNLEALNPGNLVVTNNWWGTTILSSIKAKVSNVNETNLIPYRLFGEFDITPGADVDRLPAISFVTAVGSSSNITITWTKPADIGDLVRYFVYRSTNAGYTNLSYVDVRTQMSGVNSTNLVDIPPKAGTYYYYITSLDDATPFGTIYTNESWYSVEASAVYGSCSIFVTNTNLSFNMPLNSTSGSNISFISNDGTLDCQVVGQVNDFTNFSGPYIWDVTNVNGYNQVIVEYKTNVSVAWQIIENQEQNFIIRSNLAVGEKFNLYIRIKSPSTSTAAGNYESRLRIRAVIK